MEARREDQKRSATRRGSKSPSEELLGGPPDVANLANEVFFPVDEDDSTGLLASLPQCPDTEIGAESPAEVANLAKEHFFPADDDASTGLLESLPQCPDTEIGAEGPADVATLATERFVPVVEDASTGPSASLPQCPDTEPGAEGPADVAACQEPEVPILAASTREENKPVATHVNYSPGTSARDPTPDKDDKIVDKDSKKLIVPQIIISVPSSPEPMENESGAPVDEDQARKISTDTPAPVRETAKTDPVVKIFGKASESAQNAGTSKASGSAQNAGTSKASGSAQNAGTSKASESAQNAGTSKASESLAQKAGTSKASDRHKTAASSKNDSNLPRIVRYFDSATGPPKRVPPEEEPIFEWVDLPARPSKSRMCWYYDRASPPGSQFRRPPLPERTNRNPREHLAKVVYRNGRSRSKGKSTRDQRATSERGRGRSRWRDIPGRLCRDFRKCNWIPKMCLCFDGSSPISVQYSAGRPGRYQPLESSTNHLAVCDLADRSPRHSGSEFDESVEKEPEEEMDFYHDDLSWSRIPVEKNLRVVDACQVLRTRKNVSGQEWSIVESWPELRMERTLEDHEDILSTRGEVELFSPRHETRFFFRKDYYKYEFFVNPQQFFPPDMVGGVTVHTRGVPPQPTFEELLRNYLVRNDAECPQVSGMVWILDSPGGEWKKTFMIIRDRKLYTSKTSTGAIPKQIPNRDPLIPFAHLADYNVYTIEDAGQLDSPFVWGICLRPSINAEAEDTQPGLAGLRIIVFPSAQSRDCWFTAMRLAKYGKQLRENYRAFRNKQCAEQSAGSPCPKGRYSTYDVASESLRSRVAMDFTGTSGRVVQDPDEARAIEQNEGKQWKKRWRPLCRPVPGCTAVRVHGLDRAVHVVQPWFHSGISRDVAGKILREYGAIDGTFIVRESQSTPGSCVLTYLRGGKVYHVQILCVYDNITRCYHYTLDNGRTRFYDLLQLVEFYQLNAGCLATRLTRYIQCETLGPEPEPQQENEGASAPRPPPTNQNASPKNKGPQPPNNGSAGI